MLKIQSTGKHFLFIEDGEVIAKIKDTVHLEADVYFTPMQLREEKKKLISENPKGHELSMKEPCNIIIFHLLTLLVGFSPPKFGISILGNSHGFDAKGSTSGYILWINGRGIMIDPPPFSS